MKHSIITAVTVTTLESAHNTIVATVTTESLFEESILYAFKKQIDLLIFDRKQICQFTEITNLYVSECSKIGIEYVTESDKENLQNKIEVIYEDRIKILLDYWWKASCIF